MTRSCSLSALAALERRYDGPVPPIPRDGTKEALAQSALFDRLARNAASARARARTQAYGISDEAVDSRLAGDLRLYRQVGLAWRDLSRVGKVGAGTPSRDRSPEP